MKLSRIVVIRTHGMGGHDPNPGSRATAFSMKGEQSAATSGAEPLPHWGSEAVARRV